MRFPLFPWYLFSYGNKCVSYSYGVYAAKGIIGCMMAGVLYIVLPSKFLSKGVSLGKFGKRGH